MNEPAPRHPDQIGRYPVLGVVGTGAFATVYRGRDERLDAEVAIKVLAENHAFDADLRERFILEGRLLRRLGDPHIVTVHELGETERAQPFLVLDLAAGGDLRKRAEALRAVGGTPTSDELRRVIEAVASALTTLHDAEVVHRDLAPGNLLIVGGPDEGREGGEGPQRRTLLAPGERVVVADLGLSKDLARASGLTVGTGTSGFTPPEQRAAGAWIDTRADIWSASALIAWLMTGSAPEGSPTDLRRRVADAGWPDAAAEVLAEGLSEDPDDRPDDAASWAAALGDALPGAPAAGEERPRSTSPRAPVGGRRNARWRFAAVAVVIALLAFVAGRIFAGGTDPTAVEERMVLGDGRVRHEATVGPTTLEVTGPATVEVGEEAVLEATGERMDRVDWIVPDLDEVLSGDRISVTPSGAGVATVVAVGRDADGRQIVVRYRLLVER